MRVRPVAAGAALVALLAGTASAARIVGTPGPDVLRGGPRADVLAGLGGNDLLDGGAGRDRLLGGRGADSFVAWSAERDVVSCGPGDDRVNVDRRDSVARDCELVAKQIAGDPYRNTESQHETVVEPDSFAWNSTIVAAYQLGRTFSGGATNTGFATSGDGGRTWRSGSLRGLTTFAGGSFDRASDPVVAYDAAHGAWLITSLLVSAGSGPSALVVSRSTDGLSWSGPVTVSRDRQFVYDKQWLACDNGVSSPFGGRCYMAYSDLRREQLALQRSDDGGVSWSPVVHPPDAAGRAGIRGSSGAPAPQLAIQPNGTLIVPYFDESRLAALRSLDGGVTFSRPTSIAPARFARTSFRSPPLPSADTDGSGRVYVAWPDCSLRPSCSGNDMLLARSADGVSWSQPVRIPLGAATGTASRVIPGLAADPAGKLALVYYESSRGRLDVRFVSSPDGGTTWTRPLRLSAEAFPTSWIAQTALGAMVGDYVSTVFVGNVAVPVFALARRPDRRLHEALFTARLNVP